MGMNRIDFEGIEDELVQIKDHMLSLIKRIHLRRAFDGRYISHAYGELIEVPYEEAQRDLIG